MALERFFSGVASPERPHAGEEVPGMGVASICTASCTPAWGRLASRARSGSISRGPRPALPAPGLADPTARIPALLVTAIGAAAEDSPVRRPSACILVAAGGRSLSSASSGPAVCDCVWLPCGLPGVRECMPMAITGRPSRYPKATKPANHLWEALGAVGGGCWPF
jgi:hypothetical protein